ncbi:MAG: (d)CMP kinase, partial [Planctomycetes bacterium]|nr:(d)CMP kinase [Planctomycetota bacterium]
MPSPSIIAIDGPAAVGKSTIGYELARKLGYLFVDTGALFRVVAWTALGQGVDLRAHQAVAKIAERINIQLAPPTREGQYRNTVYADGKDVTEDIYQPLIDANVALVGANPLARKALTRQMCDIAAQGR